MKNIKILGLIATLILLSSLWAIANEDEEQKVSEKEVSAKVLTAFKAAYPNAAN